MFAFFSRSPSSFALQPPSLASSCSRVRVPTPCLLPLFYERQVLYSSTLERRLPLPSGKEGNESETVRQCSAPTFRSRCLSPPLAFFHLSLLLSFSLFCFLRLPPSPSLPLSLYTRCILLHLSFSLSFSPVSFRYIRQPYFALWLTRSCLLSFLPPRGCHPPSTLLIFPPLSLKLKSIVALRARGLCRKHCYPHQLLSTTDFKKRIFRD